MCVSKGINPAQTSAVDCYRYTETMLLLAEDDLPEERQEEPWWKSDS